MNRLQAISPVFVEYIPEKLINGELYISERYGIATHLCCCGCGQEVVTPLSSAEWTVTKHGEQVSLYPSIGNWSFPCKSHYWIKRNRIEWAAAFSDRQIALVQKKDKRDIVRQIEVVNAMKKHGQPTPDQGSKGQRTFLQHVVGFLKKIFSGR